MWGGHTLAVFKEQRNLLRLYCVLLLINFLLEIIAGVLAYVYYQQLNAGLKENLKDTMEKGYPQPGHRGVSSAVDGLQQEFYCCGSNSLQDWQDREWIRLGQAGGPAVPDSCCKTSPQHLQSGGRLHHQAGDPPPGAPEGQRGRGPGHRLCVGVQRALHELLV
ncbi:hypothetical protein G4228_016455 [Cervus hanglu yarkandensis]|nr:hypothetical protein G4228_016455 [Cervus hanglu yarkandensis]